MDVFAAESIEVRDLQDSEALSANSVSQEDSYRAETTTPITVPDLGLAADISKALGIPTTRPVSLNFDGNDYIQTDLEIDQAPRVVAEESFDFAGSVGDQPKWQTPTHSGRIEVRPDVEGRYIQITNNGSVARYLQIGEIEAFQHGVTPTAGQLDPTSDRALTSRGASFESKVGGFLHGNDNGPIDGVVQTGAATFALNIAVGNSYTLDLGLDIRLGTIRLWQRGDCACQELEDFTVSILADNGSNSPGETVFSQTYPGTVPTHSFDTINVHQPAFESGNRHPALYMDSGLNNSITFDGENDHVEISRSALNNATDLTVGLWVKTDARLNMLIDASPEQFQWYHETQDDDREFTWFVTGDERVWWFVPDGITDNQPHHLALIRNDTGNQVTLYVDGKSLGTKSMQLSKIELSAADPKTLVRLGEFPSGNNDFDFEGQMDDLQFYRRVLNADEIAEMKNGIYQGGLSWRQPFNDGKLFAPGGVKLVGAEFSTTAMRPVLNEAIWSVNLSNAVAPVLEFLAVDYEDVGERNLLATTFTGSKIGDGISASPNGTTWTRVFAAADQTNGEWKSHRVSLSPNLGANAKIKFQQYDDFDIPTDGRGYDELEVLDLGKPKTSKGATFEAWVYPTERVNSGSVGVGAAVISTRKGTEGWELYHRNGIWHYRDGQNVVATNVPVDFNEWQHVAVAFDPAAGVRFYVNGENRFSRSQIRFATSPNPLSIGRAENTNFFKGRIGEVRVWDRPLSDSVVGKQWNERVDAGSANLIGYWPLDESVGSHAFDHSRAGLHASNTGATKDLSVGETGIPLPRTQNEFSASELASITSLDLSADFVDDLSGAQYLTNLQALDLSDNQLTDSDLGILVPATNGLTGLAHLERLDLSGNSQIASPFGSLNRLSDLESLDLSGTSASPTARPSQASLTELFLPVSNLTPVDLAIEEGESITLQSSRTGNWTVSPRPVGNPALTNRSSISFIPADDGLHTVRKPDGGTFTVFVSNVDPVIDELPAIDGIANEGEGVDEGQTVSAQFSGTPGKYELLIGEGASQDKIPLTFTDPGRDDLNPSLANQVTLGDADGREIDLLPKSLRFAGNRDSIETGLTIDQSVGSSGATFEAWVRPVLPASASQALFRAGDSGSLWTVTLQGAKWTASGTSGAIDNGWQHIAAVFDPENGVTLFKNGIEIDHSATIPIGDPGHDLLIGALTDTAWFFKGDIDEARVWSRPLTQAEIQDRMNGPISPLSPGLIGYWPMNEGSGNVVRDLSPQQNHGVINGNPSWNNSVPPAFEQYELPDDGDYTLTFSVDDGDGGTDRRTTSFTVDNVAPVAKFTGPSEANPGETLRFDSANSSDVSSVDNDNLSLLWEVTSNNGDSILPSSESEFVLTPKYSGTYTVKLTVTDPAGDSHFVKQEVKVNPVAGIQIVSTAPYLQGDWLTFDAAASSPVSPASLVRSGACLIADDCGVLVHKEGEQDDTLQIAVEREYTWTVSNRSRVVAEGNSETFQFLPIGGGQYTVKLSITDTFGDGSSLTVSIPAETEISVDGREPRLELLTSIRFVDDEPKLLEGDSLLLAVDHASLPARPAERSIQWQLTNPAGEAEAQSRETEFGFTADNNGDYTVSVVVTDVVDDWGQEIAAADPLNWYRFAESSGPTVVDQGRAGNHGQIDLHQAATHQIFTPNGRGVRLPGIFIDIGADALDGAWTAEFVLFHQGNSVTSEFRRGTNLLEGGGNALKLDQSPDSGELGFTRGNEDFRFTPAVATPVLPNDRIVHVVFVGDPDPNNGGVRVYMNGEKKGASPEYIPLPRDVIGR